MDDPDNGESLYRLWGASEDSSDADGESSETDRLLFKGEGNLMEEEDIVWNFPVFFLNLSFLFGGLW